VRVNGRLRYNTTYTIVFIFECVILVVTLLLLLLL